MTKALLSTLLLSLCCSVAVADNPVPDSQKDQDDQRIAALNKFWSKLSKTVKEGDYEGYGSLYHQDAVIVFATRPNKESVSIAEALSGWKEGFEKTKAGERQDNVEFRFSQRIGNENTAHETGIFHFTSLDNSGKVLVEDYIHFEMLFVKINGEWLATMEYQKSRGTQEDWDALK